MGHLNSSFQGTLSAHGNDHRAAYRDIRNFLAGQNIGATRDVTLLAEVVKMLFAKQYLEQNGSVLSSTKSDGEVSEAYARALTEVAVRLPSLFADDASFDLDTSSLVFLHDRLSTFDLSDSADDLIGDAYEAFTGSDLRGQEGQFFTPQPAVGLLMELVQPQPGERIVDPACGAGGFLYAAARRLTSNGASPEDAAAQVFGVDKDRYLARLAAIRLAFVAMTSPNIWCADSLGWRSEDGSRPAIADMEGTFDIVLTNPPFGSKIVSATAETQAKFDLGYQWKSIEGHFARTNTLRRSVPPQVLFIERCISLVRPGGRIGIVVPESLISGRNYQHVVAWLRERCEIRAVLGMPEALFKSSGKGGTHTKTCLLYLQTHEATQRSKPARDVFMAEVRWCGNDSRGRRTERDELPTVAERWSSFDAGRLHSVDHLGYAVPATNIVDDILAPRYYNPEVAIELASLSATHELVSIADLVADGVLRITTGHEVGATEYGGGSIPFVRTSDISNWEIKLDPKHGVSQEVYETYARRQDLRDGDILMVRDGTYLVGTCAYVTKYDMQMVFQSHICKLRVLNHDKLSPYLLLAALSSAPVRRQVIAKRFTQDIIDSLGNRINELVLPLPRDHAARERVQEMVKRAIEERVEARELARQACFEIIGIPIDVPEEDID